MIDPLELINRTPLEGLTRGWGREIWILTSWPLPKQGSHASLNQHCSRGIDLLPLDPVGVNAASARHVYSWWQSQFCDISMKSSFAFVRRTWQRRPGVKSYTGISNDMPYPSPVEAAGENEENCECIWISRKGPIATKKIMRQGCSNFAARMLSSNSKFGEKSDNEGQPSFTYHNPMGPKPFHSCGNFQPSHNLVGHQLLQDKHFLNRQIFQNDPLIDLSFPD
ncbi:hypothetical protein COLO4_38374 [Corchorus olitorius]|uniref:Uncharacterized protein n=1 Tax=Corchorus olitorius TaxID=93759 RepID=A0A1R3FVC1_9ROSI|nr:hypothetical protein COLO4_38374 [Corchorus olitorius]